MISIIIFLMIIAGISKSIMDTLQFHFSKSIFTKAADQSWWNPSISWKNKYKDKDPEEGPDFPGSTTIFVWITDAWHFFQQIMLMSFFISITLALSMSISLTWYWWILVYFGLKVLMTGVFQLFYGNIWV